MVGAILNIMMEMEKMNLDRIEQKIDKLRSDMEYRLNSIERDMVVEKAEKMSYSICSHSKLTLIKQDILCTTPVKYDNVYKCDNCGRTVFLSI